MKEWVRCTLQTMKGIYASRKVYLSLIRSFHPLVASVSSQTFSVDASNLKFGNHQEFCRPPTRVEFQHRMGIAETQ